MIAMFAAMLLHGAIEGRAAGARAGAKKRASLAGRGPSANFVKNSKVWAFATSLLSYIERMKALVAAILLALTMPVSAEVIDSANFLLPGCKALGRERESTPEWRRILCLAYIQGVVSGVGGKETCPPKEVTGDQVVAVVVKYIEARPERMHEQFGALAIEALTEAWPCKR